MEGVEAGKYVQMADFELMVCLEEISKVPVPAAIEEIRTAPVRHCTVCEASEMKQTVKEFLGIK